MIKNCQIVVKQKDGDNINAYLFDFDDYRVATAICNLLCNIENVNVFHHELKGDYNEL